MTPGRGSRRRRRGSEDAAKQPAYRVEYSREAVSHLRVLTARQQRAILGTVDEQLSFEPTLQTRNRKPLEPNPVAAWALRLGELRVYYDVGTEPESVVLIRAIGVKVRNRVHIGGEVVDI